MAYDERLAERIRTALGRRDDVEEKRMFGGIAFLLDGHMACGIVGDRLMLRLDPDEAARRLAEPHVRPMDFTGRPMRGFLYVDPKGLATARRLDTWLARAIAHAERLPPKAPKRTPRPRVR
jgi:TfoX/Sxy family transcriptional regulator of competence genes